MEKVQDGQQKMEMYGYQKIIMVHTHRTGTFNTKKEVIPVFIRKTEIKPLSKGGAAREISRHFAFYPYYMLFGDYESLDIPTEGLPYDFTFQRVEVIAPLQERNYALEERKRISIDCMRTMNPIFEKDLENKQVLVIHDTRKPMKYIPGFLKKEIGWIREVLPEMTRYKNCCGLKIYGTKKFESLFKQIAVSPFLLSYEDISFIPYGENYFYTVNHHLDIFKVDYTEKPARDKNIRAYSKIVTENL